MRALLLNSSPHGAASHGYQLARGMLDALDTFDTSDTLAANSPHGPTIERDLAAIPLPPIDAAYATAITSRPGADLPEAFGWSERLISELEDTDLLVINTPMHNFTVPAALKLWIDHVLRIHRTFASTPDGKVGLMKDRPTFVLVGSGGIHTGSRAQQPDFLTPYLRYALGSIGIVSVRFVLLQGLVFGADTVAAQLADARSELLRHAPFDAIAAASLQPTST